MTASVSKISNSNLINTLPYTWAPGSGSSTGYNQNGATAENERVLATGPYGAQAIVWEARPTSTTDADGGWNSDYSSIDNTKLYRFSVWVRRTSSTSGGTFYFGLYTNGTNQVVSLQSGAAEGNPYWDYRGTGWFTQNVWYLVVGHIYPYTYSATYANPASGIYTQAGGMVGSLAGNIPQDCKFPSNATTTMNRTYLYYCSDSTTRLQFYQPRIDLVDGNEPSITAMLAQDFINPSNAPQGVKFSDNTVQTTLYGTAQQHGQLIGVTSFIKSDTWYKPPGCNRVLVKVVGGGGGSAGYMESGGGGGYTERFIDVSTISSVAVTIGGGGTLAVYYAAAGDGGTSSFGSYATATGGYGANRNYSHTGGHGGVGSGGSVNLYGGDGLGHTNSAGHYPGGVGGGTYFGGSATVNRDTTSTKIGPGAPGTGAPGGRTNDGERGTWAEDGLVVVYAYK